MKENYSDMDKDSGCDAECYFLYNDFGVHIGNYLYNNSVSTKII